MHEEHLLLNDDGHNFYPATQLMELDRGGFVPPLRRIPTVLQQTVRSQYTRCLCSGFMHLLEQLSKGKAQERAFRPNIIQVTNYHHCSVLKRNQEIG